ncbi:unnamed protein product [Blepharisma stoltei]|uniref:Uncharacterized protein n=1 Tax=Blepharisma stoltei TaxID=1481888 RepID=A0AAU9IWI9_9CILI|nr:unnamed protein product [Blepharisma stoltei]
MSKSSNNKDEREDSKPLVKSEDFSSKASIKLLFSYAGKYEWTLIAVGFSMILLFRFFPFFLFYQLGEAVEAVYENPDDDDEFYEGMRDACIWMLLGGLMCLVLGWIAVICFLLAAKSISLKWRSVYFYTIINRPIKWYDRNNPSELSSAIDMDIDAIEQGVGLKFFLQLSMAISYFGLFIFTGIINLQLTLIALIPIPLQFYGIVVYEKVTIDSALAKQEKYKSAGGIAEESFEGVKTIASCNAQKPRTELYHSELKTLRDETTKIGVYQGFLYSITAVIFFVLTGVTFYYGSIFLRDDRYNWTLDEEIERKDIVVVSLCFMMTAFCQGIFVTVVNVINNAKVAAARVHEVVQINKRYGGYLKPKSIKGDIDFENVHFRYPTKKDVPILKGVSFKVREKESLAIVGQTGSGKSTIIQLIEGFYYCEKGTILIDGVDITQYDISALRGFVGLVSQEPILFNTTIKENIRIGRMDATDGEIENAAREAEATFIEDLENKFDTYVGIKGSLLSGGQKQRVAIARALLKNPSILLLDEATSALDVKTEKKIQVTLDKVSQNRTTVIVAQRLSSVKNANKIIVISEGVVAEEGNHESLIKLNGRYARYCEIQSKTEEAMEEEAPSSKEAESERDQDVMSYQTSIYKRVKADKSKYMKGIHVQLLKQWDWMLVAAICAIIAGLCYPCMGFVFADDIISVTEDNGGELQDTTWDNLWWSVLLAAIAFVTIVILYSALGRTAALFTDDIRMRGMNAILYYDQKFFDKPINNPALLSYTFSKDCEKISSIGGSVLIFQLLTVSSLVLAIVWALCKDWVYALIATALFSIMIVVNMGGDVFRQNDKMTPAQTTQIAFDCLTNIKTVNSLNKQDYFHVRYVNSCKEANKGIVVSYIPDAFRFSLKLAVMFFVWGFALWIGAAQVKEKHLSRDNLLYVFFIILLATYSAIVLSFLPQDTDEGIKSAIKMNDIIEYEPEINGDSKDGETDPISGKITYENVCFKYEGRLNPVLKNVSFEVPAGKTLGVTGSTGSGKSTIAQLLLRFYNPTSGIIKLDDHLIQNYNIRHLREYVCWVGQEPILFKGTMMYNLRLANQLATEEEAREALIKAQAGDILEKYGLENDVGLRGSKLSGGQKQRVAIARALIRKPKILVLDEATSALDTVVESKLQEVLKQEKFTVISVAHRLRTIKDCDEILVLEKGILVEKGTHDELSKNPNGYYYQLCQLSTA